MTPALSVVVPTRDRPEHLDRCLTALRAELGPDDELLVVDSASRDPAVADVVRAHQARLIRCERPGASLARNAGAAAAAHDLLAYVDDDVRVAPGWASALAKALLHPDHAFVTGRVAAPEGQRERQRLVALKEDLEPSTLDPTTPSPLGSSANLGIRRAVLLAAGGFDEALGGGARFAAGEDLDLFDRLLAAGYRGRYEPAALAWHEQWRSRGQLLRLDWRYGLGGGARLAKLVRTDRRRFGRAVREGPWSDGIVVAVRGVRTRQEFLVATGLLRAAGTAAGFLLGLVLRLDRGCYAAPAR